MDAGVVAVDANLLLFPWFLIVFIFLLVCASFLRPLFFPPSLSLLSTSAFHLFTFSTDVHATLRLAVAQYGPVERRRDSISPSPRLPWVCTQAYNPQRPALHTNSYASPPKCSRYRLGGRGGSCEYSRERIALEEIWCYLHLLKVVNPGSIRNSMVQGVTEYGIGRGKGGIACIGGGGFPLDYAAHVLEVT